jgi:predicted TIM-barrel fold metal-dependent hydrolase
MTELAAWLSRTTETALEPELAICDPHHHLWEYPTSRYLREEFLQDIEGGHRVLATVHIECLQWYRDAGPEALRPVGETEFIHRVGEIDERACGRRRIAAGIVGFADLRLGAAVQPVLEAHLAASDRFRGVRYATAWDASSEIRPTHTHPPPGLLADPAFRAGFACLARLGLSFDAWLYHTQFAELAGLARAFPAVTIVLDHMGGPLGVGPYAGRRAEVFAAWRASLAELAGCPNVVVKLGGRTMAASGFGWHKRAAPPGSEELAAAMAPYYRACIELFGAQRCMFESNFPFDRASCSYVVLWNAYKRLSHDYPEADRRALFYDTAERVYRLAAH